MTDHVLGPHGWLWRRTLRWLGGVASLGRAKRARLRWAVWEAAEIGAIRERVRTLELLRRCQLLGLSLSDLEREITAESCEAVALKRARAVATTSEGGIAGG